MNKKKLPRLPAVSKNTLLAELSCVLPGSQFHIADAKSVSRLTVDNQHTYEARGGSRDWRYRALLMLCRDEKKCGEL